jgi:hypothetical protein
MTTVDQHHSAVVDRKKDRSPYSVSRSVAIIVGLSLSLWAIGGLVLYEVL